MSTPSYIATNIEELLDAAPESVYQMIAGEEVSNATAILGKSYKIPIGAYISLENIITFLLIGALKPENAVQGIQDLLGVDQDTAIKLAQDLDKTILEKARVKIFNKVPTEMVTLKLDDGSPSVDELRKEIMDTTKRGPIASDPKAPAAPKTTAKTSLIPGSRMALMEQLKLLDDIPNDEEIAKRLEKIQEQIASMPEPQEEGGLTPAPIALEEIMPKDGVQTQVEPVKKAATYATAPTHYNVDPYREVTEE